MRSLLLALAACHCLVAAAHTVVIYSSHDTAQALRAYGLARAYDDAFIARDLRPGAAWREAIAGELCAADTVLVMWSERAAASREVEKELAIASFCERQLVPVLLDSTPLPSELRDIHAVDWR